MAAEREVPDLGGGEQVMREAELDRTHAIEGAQVLGREAHVQAAEVSPVSNLLVSLGIVLLLIMRSPSTQVSFGKSTIGP